MVPFMWQKMGWKRIFARWTPIIPMAHIAKVSDGLLLFWKSHQRKMISIICILTNDKLVIISSSCFFCFYKWGLFSSLHLPTCRKMIEHALTQIGYFNHLGNTYRRQHGKNKTGISIALSGGNKQRRKSPIRQKYWIHMDWNLFSPFSYCPKEKLAIWDLKVPSRWLLLAELPIFMILSRKSL